MPSFSGWIIWRSAALDNAHAAPSLLKLILNLNGRPHRAHTEASNFSANDYLGLALIRG